MKIHKESLEIKETFFFSPGHREHPDLAAYFLRERDTAQGAVLVSMYVSLIPLPLSTFSGNR